MSFDAIVAALRGGEAKVSNQALRDAVGLEPRDACVFRLRLLAVEILEAAQANRVVFAGEVVASEPLLEKRRRGV